MFVSFLLSVSGLIDPVVGRGESPVPEILVQNAQLLAAAAAVVLVQPAIPPPKHQPKLPHVISQQDYLRQDLRILN